MPCMQIIRRCDDGDYCILKYVDEALRYGVGIFNWPAIFQASGYTCLSWTDMCALSCLSWIVLARMSVNHRSGFRREV